MQHIPVLKDEIIEGFSYLKNRKGGVFIDGTLGAGNHSIAIAEQLKAKGVRLKAIGIDKDIEALKLAEKNIKKAGLYDNLILVHDDYKNINKILRSLSLPQNDRKIDGALLDLGVSSMQLDNKERGFSFLEPSALLDMRMDQDMDLTAADVLNRYSKEKIEQILKDFGQERFAKIISINIAKERVKKQFKTVGDLLSVLERSVPIKIQKVGKIHFATKTFQALRIEVNEELKNLEQTIKDFVNLLKPNSKLAIISFHSLEDRIVKQTFKELTKDCVCPPLSPICNCNHKAIVKILTKKPTAPSNEETSINPRSKSAKLRIIEKLQ